MATGDLSPVIAKLRQLPHPRYGNPVWPQGSRQPYNAEIADHFFSLISTCETSLLQLLRAHPELPPFVQLDSWRCNNKHGFADRWRKARQAQAHFLADKCADLLAEANPKTAHVVRVKFDILKWLAAKFHPAHFGDKPINGPVQTVNIGVSIGPERLNDLRGRLDNARQFMKSRPKPLKLAPSAVAPRLLSSNASSASSNGADVENVEPEPAQ